MVQIQMKTATLQVKQSGPLGESDPQRHPVTFVLLSDDERPGHDLAPAFNDHVGGSLSEFKLVNENGEDPGVPEVSALWV
jgi:hypothetical protein